MIANYHTHTWRCNHAAGTEEAYVCRALENGLQILGFSDHTPQFFPGEYYSGFRMRPEQLEDYVNSVLALREKYAHRLQIHLGLEVEYYPNLLPVLLPVLREQPIEYLLLGQHLLGDEMGEHYNGRPTDSRELLRRYCSQTAQAMNTGLFTYFAHPDLFYFTGEEKFYREQIRALCKEANRCAMPLEVNLLGVIEGRHYPNRVFWQEAAEENCKVVIGRDAHAPEQFDRADALSQAEAMIRAYGLTCLETVPLRSI